jgi:RNA polymerase sigma-70 factor (ECF subfamily)
MDDTLLLQQISEGSETAFDLLYEKYWSIAYSAAYKRLKDEDQAKDVIQEIFIHVWVKRETLVINNFPAYLNIAVRNKVFKVLAKQSHDHPFFEVLDNLPATYLQADYNLIWKEFFNSYEALLNALPQQRKTIFRLRFQEDKSTTDIAGQLGISKKTVQNQLSLAFDQLKLSLIHLLTIAIIFSTKLF